MRIVLQDRRKSERARRAMSAESIFADQRERLQAKVVRQLVAFVGGDRVSADYTVNVSNYLGRAAVAATANQTKGVK